MKLQPRKFFAGLIFIPLAFSICRAAEIGGIVKDKDTGLGIAHVVVRAISVQPTAKVYEGHTDRNGAYVLHVQHGRYRVSAIPAGTNYLPGYFSEPKEPSVPGVVDLVAEDVFTFANITLEQGASIEGHVRRLADGVPLENVRVTAESESTRTVTTTDKNGRYLLRALPPNTYTIEAGVLDSNYIPIFYPRAAFREQAEKMTVRTGEKVSGIDLKLEFGASIRGHILSATTNQPLSEIMAIAVPTQGNQPERFAYTDRSGFYSIHGLSRGEYRIEAGDEQASSAEGTRQRRFITQFYDHEFDRELAKPVQVTGAEMITGIDFSLYRGNHITGYIRSAYYNQPLSNVLVRPVASGERKTPTPIAVSNAEGEYEVNDLPPGNYSVTVDLPETSKQHVATWYRDQVARRKATLIPLEDGDRYPNVDFNLRLGGNIYGRVTLDDPDYPLEYKRLHIVMSTVSNEIDGFEPRVYDLSDEGRYSIMGSPIGRFHLIVTSEDPNVMLGSSSDMKTIYVAEGRELRDVDFSLRLGGSISGKVTIKRSHLTIDHYRILVLRMNDPYHEFVKIQGDSYKVPGLRSGKYVVILVEEADPLTLEKVFTGPRWYDSKIVEIKRGVALTNVDFVINESVPPIIP